MRVLTIVGPAGRCNRARPERPQPSGPWTRRQPLTALLTSAIKDLLVRLAGQGAAPIEGGTVSVIGAPSLVELPLNDATFWAAPLMPAWSSFPDLSEPPSDDSLALSWSIGATS